MATIPTVRVFMKAGGHQALINESDFDPDLHAMSVDAPADDSAPASESEEFVNADQPEQPKRGRKAGK